MSKTTSALLSLLIAAMLVVFAVIAATIGFGWFADSLDASATGMGVSAKGNLQIRKVPGGKDVGVAQPESGMTRLELALDPSSLTNGSGENISPGASGSFTFYVYKPDRSTYSFICRPEVINDRFAANEGCYPDATEENKALALKFANSHIMMFREKSADGVYSGWISPDKPMQVDAADHEQSVTIYWVWVPFYSYIFDGGWSKLASVDQAAIKAYYDQEDNLGKMFTQSGGVYRQSSTGYNEADFVFGSTLRRICFDVYVQEV